MANLPQVLPLRKPSAYSLFGEQLFTSNKFHFLKAYESTLPLHQFLTTHAQSVQAIFSSAGAPVTANILQLHPEVRLVVATSAGLNHIDVGECHCRGGAVANAGNVFSEDVTDFVVGLLIAVLRKISAANRFVRQGLWPTNGGYPLGSELGGKRVGIVGLGALVTKLPKGLRPSAAAFHTTQGRKNLL